jgi:hypothetical protein
MTVIGTSIAGLLAGGKVATGGLLAASVVWAGGVSDGGPGGGEGASHTALVIDAAAGRDGRELVDPRLDAVDAEVRLPRTLAEARTNVLYFDAQGYRVVVAGPRAASAADAAGVPAVRTADLGAALAAVEGQ